MKRITEEHKVGETFKVNGQTYEVRESDGCDGCVLQGCLPEFTEEKARAFGLCSKVNRVDGKSVIFVKAGKPRKAKIVKRELLPVTRCVRLYLEDGGYMQLGQCPYAVCLYPERQCTECEENFFMF